MKSHLHTMLLQAIAAGLASETPASRYVTIKTNKNLVRREHIEDIPDSARRSPKHSWPLAEQLKAKAEAKRERKAKRLKWGYYFCVKNNPCLKNTGRNFLTAGNRPC